MNRTYWEKIAPEYNQEIFDVLENDRKGIIVSAIRQIASKEKSVADIGCAIGKWLPLLSPLFKKVYAIDISAENLKIAAGLYPKLKNVAYCRTDMSDPRAKITACDAAICINAILTDSLKNRNAFFRNLQKCVKKDGQLILVNPSLESSLFTSIIRQRWNPDKDAHAVVNKSKQGDQLRNLLHGNVEIDNVPTKHYLKEELQLLLNNEGFEVLRFEKIEYKWTTEFLNPPRWLKQPKPWDWMVLAVNK